MISITVDLRNQFGPARNQGDRPTCLAFAGSDAHAHARNTNEYLSAEYAHFNATRRRTPPRPELAATIPLMIAAIREDGQPLENAWPYLAALPSPLSDYQPPPNLGPCFRHTFTETPPKTEQILETLNAGQPALLGLRITQQFHYPPPDRIIRLTHPDPPTANHAVLCVGWGTIATTTVFLVRNSWGEQWASGGHIWLTDDYVRAQLLALARSAKGVPTQ
jgi:hypothetical protein